METIKIQHWDQYICCHKQYDSAVLRHVVANLDHVIEKCSEILKNDSTSTVIKTEIGEQVWVIKRSNTKGAMHFIRRLFQPSRAQINWDFAKRLQALSIPTLEPIALVEERWGVFKRRSYFICQYLAGPSALAYFTDLAFETRSYWPAVASEMVSLIQTLANSKYYHQDLNLSNFIMLNNKPHLIDLDSMRYRYFSPTSFLFQKLRDRFMENWLEVDPVPTEIIRLFQYEFEKLVNLKR